MTFGVVGLDLGLHRHAARVWTNCWTPNRPSRRATAAGSGLLTLTGPWLPPLVRDLPVHEAERCRIFRGRGICLGRRLFQVGRLSGISREHRGTV
jgi:hypothetical protein